jgi:hypothetical protein
MLALLKRPSAFLPLAMSAVVLGFIVSRLALYGTLRELDENAGAHLFQILMPAQLPIIVFFALTWLPRNRRDALPVFGLQCAAAFAVFALVFAFHG